ncbi:beta-lactamase family protein [Streptomyces sp. NBC_01230]|uniref:serine hydrolase domain-containing protein n=1 Tax=unclassified Streptomyces TaxID=2593676 RepID=UPI002E1357B4|nr:beta-lactamase family protein [Streptomyces sp. NBC_01230]
MRFVALATGVLASAVLAVPLAAPALAAPASPAAASADRQWSGSPDHGHGPHRDHVRHHAPGEGRNNARLQKVLDSIVAAGAPGVIAEVRDNDGTWVGRSGKGNLERDEPTRANGLFRVGSVTKSFVATTVLQLVDEGALRLDDPVERHLPGLLPGGDKITVRHLLSHRSGLFNYTDSLWADGLQGFSKTRFKHYTPHQLVDEMNAHKPLFAPGTAGSYSNANYVVLGLLIEKTTGHSVKAEIMKRIVDPLHLHRTSFPETSTRIPGPHAHGYVRLQGPGSAYTDLTESSMSWAWTAGAIISDTHDLNTFYKALIEGKLLPAKLMKQMKNAQQLRDGGFYGLGLAKFADPAFGTAYGHVGGTPGFTTHSFTLADGSRQVTLSINSMADTDRENTAAGEAVKTLLAKGIRAE